MNRMTIYLLTIGVFLAGTAEYMIAGVLDMVAIDLRIGIALAGQLVTAYALAYAIGTPILIMFSAKLERKIVLAAAMGVFVIGNVIAWWSSNFTVLLLSRILLGLSGGVYTVAAMSTVSKLVPKDKLGYAIGTLTMGISGSLVFGVPLGIALSGWIGWRSAFAALAAASMIVSIGVLCSVPSLPAGERVPFARQFAVFHNLKVVAGFFVTLFWIAGYAVAYTFLAPFLRETVNMDTITISFTMFILGLFAVAGSRLGGYGADRWGVIRTVLFSMSLHALALLLLPVLNATVVTAVLIVAIWIGSAWTTSPAIQTYFIQQAPTSPDLPLSLNSSVLQFGIALGAGLGGIVVNAAGSVEMTPLIGAGFVLLGMIAAWTSFSMRTTETFYQRNTR